MRKRRVGEENALASQLRQNTIKAYSPSMIALKHLAPVTTQRLVSFLIFSKITKEGANLFSKTPAFLSFHSSHKTSKVREAMTFRLGPESIREHYSLTLRPDQT